METPQEKKNHATGLAVSLTVHGLLILLFVFLMAWRAPNPPAPEYGIEVNFGVADSGKGEEQPTTQTGGEQSRQEPAEQDDPVEESPQEVRPEATPETKPEVTSPDESAVAATEKIIKEEPVKEPAKKKTEEARPTEKVAEEKKEQKSEATAKTETKTSEGKSQNKETANQGNDATKAGDKGQPEGTLDPNAQYTGKPGGGGGGDGFALSMAGWEWAEKPVIPELPDNEDGRIEFEIECDENGEILGIKTLQRGLSARAEQLLKDEIRKNSLIRTSSGKTPERSKGKVVFVLRTR